MRLEFDRAHASCLLAADEVSQWLASHGWMATAAFFKQYLPFCYHKIEDWT